jgi:hypothetical protein
MLHPIAKERHLAGSLAIGVGRHRGETGDPRMVGCGDELAEPMGHDASPQMPIAEAFETYQGAAIFERS